jgi:hypothetical protein
LYSEKQAAANIGKNENRKEGKNLSSFFKTGHFIFEQKLNSN